ncbi:hypothetical protein IAD21_02366 [Abditibacteriota bacterium]|nr:hypothetical protein IAD21_02366 [Abditibacteriota bacterium]
MNINYLLIPLLLALSSLSVRAQTSTENKAAAQQISYARGVPYSVVRLMPRGAKSLFSGLFTPKEGDVSLAIHLYNNRKREPRHEFTRVLGLDMFQAKGKGWKKINRISIRYLTDEGDKDKVVNAQLLWLDRQQLTPVLKLILFDPDGPEGDETSLVFLTGWTGKALSQTWSWGRRSSSPIDNDWSQRDEKGMLKVTSFLTNMYSMAFPLETRYYEWHGDGFHLTKQEVMDMNGKTEEIPIKP